MDIVRRNYRRIARAFVTGNFDYCLVLINRELARKGYKPHFNESFGVYKVRVLSSQGKMEEAERAANDIDWLSTNSKNDLNHLLVAKALNNREQMKAVTDELLSDLYLIMYMVIDMDKSGKDYSRECLIELTETLQILGNVDLATRYAKSVLDMILNIGLPHHQWFRGRAALVMGDQALARLSFTKARKFDPENYWVEQTLKQLSKQPEGKSFD